MSQETATRRSGLRQPAVLAWLRLLRVARKVERASGEHLRRWGLSEAQFDVIAHVGAAEGQRQQDLADSLLVTKGNVCQLLDRLEQAGLLVRRQDGRANRLYLTEAGRRLFREVVPDHEATVAQQFAALGQDDQAELLRLLRRLDRALPG